MGELPKSLGPFLTGDRPLPESPDAERAVLACLLLDAANTADRIFARLPTVECFHVPAHREIYRSIQDMRQNRKAHVDVITVGDRLNPEGPTASLGGQEYLAKVRDTVATTANLDKYLDTVLDAYVLRRLIKASSEIAGRCFEAPSDVAELVDGIEKEVLEITQLRFETEAKSLGQLVWSSIDYLLRLSRNDPSVMGIPTGFAGIDRLITGFRPGQLIVLAARPSIGKTALALNIAANIGLKQDDRHPRNPVAVFSLEMSAEDIALRMLCTEAKTNVKDVRDGKVTDAQYNEIDRTAKLLAAAPVFVDDTPQLSALELKQKARRLVREHGVKMLVVDYLQLMRPGGSSDVNREQQVARMSSDIKALARELSVPVLLVAQLNRQAEPEGTGNQPSKARPKMSHLRESGSIEQDADIVMLLHREREVPRNHKPGDHLDCELIIAKHRNGETGTVELCFFPEYTLFRDPKRIPDEDAVPQRETESNF